MLRRGRQALMISAMAATLAACGGEENASALKEIASVRSQMEPQEAILGTWHRVDEPDVGVQFLGSGDWRNTASEEAGQYAFVESGLVKLTSPLGSAFLRVEFNGDLLRQCDPDDAAECTYWLAEGGELSRDGDPAVVEQLIGEWRNVSPDGWSSYSGPLERMAAEERGFEMEGDWYLTVERESGGLQARHENRVHDMKFDMDVRFVTPTRAMLQSTACREKGQPCDETQTLHLVPATVDGETVFASIGRTIHSYGVGRSWTYFRRTSQSVAAAPQAGAGDPLEKRVQADFPGFTLATDEGAADFDSDGRNDQVASIYDSSGTKIVVFWGKGGSTALEDRFAREHQAIHIKHPGESVSLGEDEDPIPVGKTDAIMIYMKAVGALLRWDPSRGAFVATE